MLYISDLIIGKFFFVFSLDANIQSPIVFLASFAKLVST